MILRGRITSQRRDGYVNNATGGEYSYYAQSNRLEKISAGMSNDVDFNRNMTSNESFIYDHDGNMIEDKSKQMTVRYNHRGLPVEFKRESSSSENAADSVRLVLNYEGAGSRISKIRERKSASETEWTTELTTHYTGIGSEIREDAINNATKVVVNLPQGLGRYDIASASEPSANTVPSFEWYLKNHLGSTMLVYGTQGISDPTISNLGSLKAAYDYRAFGEQVDLTMPTDKVTETFTGKEKDDETELSYFGARYLDQMLGMWVSVDAKRQFNSPYLYAGNGTNPVRFFDPNGKEIIFASDKEREMYKSLWSSLTPVAQERIQALEKSKNIYKLNYRPPETRNQEIVFDENGTVLSQDKGGTKNGGFVPKSNGGDIFFDGTKESLGHELGGHGYQMDRLILFTEGDIAVEIFNSNYTNNEKFRIDVERDAADIGGHEFNEEYYKD